MVMSLKDPVSTMRIELPCRSTVCAHNQCFDVSSFIQLQEQAPTWSCPICNKIISFEALAVDHYVLDILQQTSQSVEQVQVEPEGEWKAIKQDDSVASGGRVRRQTRASYDEASDDDLVEIVEARDGAPMKQEPGLAITPSLIQHTPPLSSRETSAPRMSASRSISGVGRKRPSAVIDLTLSDDDDGDDDGEARQRPNKRLAVPATYNSPASTLDSRISLPQGLQHRPSITNPVQIQISPTNTPSLATNGGAPQVPSPEGSSQSLPWPQAYSSYGSPWAVHRQDQSDGRRDQSDGRQDPR